MTDGIRVIAAGSPIRRPPDTHLYTHPCREGVVGYHLAFLRTSKHHFIGRDSCKKSQHKLDVYSYV